MEGLGPTDAVVLEASTGSFQFATTLLCWRHSGFSVDNSVRLDGDDHHARQATAKYEWSLRAKPALAIRAVLRTSPELPCRCRSSPTTGPAERSCITPPLRNTRHTIHVQQLPPSVRIIREKHALEGRILGVLGHMRRRSGLQLILALPEGGTASVPASWTDLESPAAAGVNQNHRGRTLGSAADLLHTRSVVDALLRPLDSEHSCPAAEEGSNATGASAVARETAGLGASECRASSDADQGACAPPEKSCPCGAEEGHQ